MHSKIFHSRICRPFPRGPRRKQKKSISAGIPQLPDPSPRYSRNIHTHTRGKPTDSAGFPPSPSPCTPLPLCTVSGKKFWTTEARTRGQPIQESAGSNPYCVRCCSCSVEPVTAFELNRHSFFLPQNTTSQKNNQYHQGKRQFQEAMLMF